MPSSTEATALVRQEALSHTNTIRAGAPATHLPFGRILRAIRRLLKLQVSALRNELLEHYFCPANPYGRKLRGVPNEFLTVTNLGPGWWSSFDTW